MKKLFSVNVPTPEMTTKVAQRICDTYLKDNFPFSVFLEGGLGAGKTFLVRKMIEYLGVKGEVTSPTYTYVNEYTCDLGDISHFDLYRMESDHDFFVKGFEEIASDETQGCFVEWPSKISAETQASFVGAKYKIVIKFGIGVGMREIILYQVD